MSTTLNKLVTSHQPRDDNKAYYDQAGIIELLAALAAPEERRVIIEFIKTSTTNWSKHLVLNTHKKQTENTPCYSTEIGPGILTVLLERGDLDQHERAPQVQLIFSRDNATGVVSLTPRIEGCMVTTRMLDTYDQINRELMLGKTVTFLSAEQIITYIEQVAAHNATAIAFRQELGDPKTALLQSGVSQDVRLTFSATLAGNQLEVQTLVEDEQERDDNILNIIKLDNVGEDGRISLEISAKTRFNSAQASAHALHTTPEFQEVWDEVRATPGTDDANVLAAEARLTAAKEHVVEPAALPEQAAKEAPKEVERASIEAVYPAFTSKMHVNIQGDDKHLLAYVIARTLDSDIGVDDIRALQAFKQYVLDGEGLANVDNWGFHAMTVRDGGAQLSQNFMRAGNNFFIAIYDRTVNITTDKLATLVIYQCKLAD